jgi:hypothetical protein
VDATVAATQAELVKVTQARAAAQKALQDMYAH